MLDSTTFNRIRRNVMKNIAPEFESRKTTYVRNTPSFQVHCLEFSIRKRGGGFCVDLGLHFADVPSFEVFSPPTKLEHPHPTSCCFQQRWRNARHEQFFEYGETPEETAELLTQIVNDCQQRLAEVAARWPDGEAMLHTLTPDVLRADAVTFQRLLACPSLEEQDRISDSMTIRQLFPGWCPQVSSLCVLLAFLARDSGRPELIPEYLSITELPGQGHIMLPRAASLTDTLLK